jgi:hypothetical protein
VSIIIAGKTERLKGLCQQKDEELQNVSECMKRFIEAAEQKSNLLEEMYVQKYLNMFLVLIAAALQDVHICIFTQPNLQYSSFNVNQLHLKQYFTLTCQIHISVRELAI